MPKRPERTFSIMVGEYKSLRNNLKRVEPHHSETRIFWNILHYLFTSYKYCISFSAYHPTRKNNLLILSLNLPIFEFRRVTETEDVSDSKFVRWAKKQRLRSFLSGCMGSLQGFFFPQFSFFFLP